MKKLKYWFLVFLIIFSVATLGLFLFALGLGNNALTASGAALLLAATLFSILFVWYGSQVKEDD